MPYMELLPYSYGGVSHIYRNPLLQLVNGVSIQSSLKSFIELWLRRILTWPRPKYQGPQISIVFAADPHAYGVYIKDTGYGLGTTSVSDVPDDS